jgi:hypothetical protein
VRGEPCPPTEVKTSALMVETLSSLQVRFVQPLQQIDTTRKVRGIVFRVVRVQLIRTLVYAQSSNYCMCRCHDLHAVVVLDIYFGLSIVMTLIFKQDIIFVWKWNYLFCLYLVFLVAEFFITI